MAEKIKYAPFRRGQKRAAALLLSLILSISIPSLCTGIAATDTAAGGAAGDRYITLSAPDIKTGESTVKIGDTKYIRYSVTIMEYKTLYYSSVSFDLEYDDTVLDLYTTNINLRQIYAYDIVNGAERNTQDSIVWYEPELLGNKISFSSYSTTGMWFRGPVIILYFLLHDGAKTGDVCNITISNFNVGILNIDGSPAATDNISVTSRNGTVTVTEIQNYNEGETMNLSPDTSPFKGKGDPGLEASTSAVSDDGAVLYYTIVMLVLIIIIGVVLLGWLIINRMLKPGLPHGGSDNREQKNKSKM